MPNCAEPECITYVTDVGLYCRIHQDRDADEKEYMVTYNGEGIVQMPFGNFSKGNCGRVNGRQAEPLKADKDWTVEEV